MENQHVEANGRSSTTVMETRGGVILAGGRSTRFGDRDKAIAELGGVPMIRRVGDRLQPAVDTIVINCRKAQCGSIQAAFAGFPGDLHFAYDREPDVGPVGGIRAGLTTLADETPAQAGFVVACDMPFLDPELVSYLFDRLAAEHDAVVPRLDDGWFQPTHAVYRPEAMANACHRAIQRDQRRILEVIEELSVRIVEEEDLVAVGNLRSFENVNTREEFESAATAFED